MATEIVPGIIQIDTKPLGHENLIASYLVRGSDKTALIDPGFPSSVQTVIDECRSVGVEGGQIDYIVLTHSHIDHAGGAGLLAETAAGAKLVTHKRGVFYLKNSMKITGGSSIVFGLELGEQFGDGADVSADRILAVSDGDVVDLGDKQLQVFRTPGHSGDHISLFEPATGTLFPGDTACLHYPQLGHVLIPAGSPPIYRSDYVVEELRRLSELDVKAVLTPHFSQPEGEPGAFLAANIEAVTSTRADIEAMLNRGLEFPQVVEALRDKVLAAAGIPRQDIPDFLADVWLRIMLRTGLMGYMADILQYARDLRPFHEFSCDPGVMV